MLFAFVAFATPSSTVAIKQVQGLSMVPSKGMPRKQDLQPVPHIEKDMGLLLFVYGWSCSPIAF